MLLIQVQLFLGLSHPKETALPQASQLPRKTGLEAVKLLPEPHLALLSLYLCWQECIPGSPELALSLKMIGKRWLFLAQEIQSYFNDKLYLL